MYEASTLNALAATVVESTDDAIVVGGSDGGVVYVNPGFTRLFGYTLDDLLGKMPIQVLAGPHTDLQALAQVRDMRSPTSYRIELLLYTRAGQPLWVAVVVNAVRDAHGALRHMVGVLSDITLTKMREMLQRRALDAMAHERSVEDLTQVLCDEVERIAPELLCSVLAVDALGLLHPLAGPRLPVALGEAMDGLPLGALSRAEALQPDPLWELYRHIVEPMGVQACWCCLIRGSDGAVRGLLALYFRGTQDPSPFHRQLVAICAQLCALALDRSHARMRMEELASFDMLTGLANRIALKERAEQVAAELAQSQTTMAVLSIDLDRFKRINEVHGTAVGDAVLREVAGRLMRAVRSIDITGRLDGDGFAAILPTCSVQQAAQAAERVQAAIAAPLVQGDVLLALSASVGVAMFPDDGTDVGELLHHADVALAQAKADGSRGSVRFFNEEMQQRLRERVALETALRDGLRDGGLKLHYQPQIDRRSGLLYGVEALARWNHPELGEIPPARFIPLAEEAGLVEELGCWALGEACQQMGQWRRDGVAVARVAVNLSARNFRQPGLVALVSGLLAAHGLVAADLTLEMTESVMLEATPQVLDTLTNLRELGVHLSLDDFGTGYSSLSYLHRLPIHELKLDQSFVRNLADSATARALTNTILRIGDSLKLTVVAEGVETEAQSWLLAERGSAIVQGYLYGRPMPAADLATWLTTHNSAGAGPTGQGAIVLGV